jgi:hypothetical protein
MLFEYSRYEKSNFDGLQVHTIDVFFFKLQKVKEATWKKFHRKGYGILKRATAYLYTKFRSLFLALIKKGTKPAKYSKTF